MMQLKLHALQYAPISVIPHLPDYSLVQPDSFFFFDDKQGLVQCQHRFSGSTQFRVAVSGAHLEQRH